MPPTLSPQSRQEMSGAASCMPAQAEAYALRRRARRVGTTMRRARSARFTAPAFGNASAMSGSSTTTFVPSRHRTAYLPRIPPRKSYSGRIVSRSAERLVLFLIGSSFSAERLGLTPDDLARRHCRIAGSSGRRPSRLMRYLVLVPPSGRGSRGTGARVPRWFAARPAPAPAESPRSAPTESRHALLDRSPHLVQVDREVSVNENIAHTDGP